MKRTCDIYGPDETVGPCQTSGQRHVPSRSVTAASTTHTTAPTPEVVWIWDPVSRDSSHFPRGSARGSGSAGEVLVVQRRWFSKGLDSIRRAHDIVECLGLPLDQFQISCNREGAGAGPVTWVGIRDRGSTKRKVISVTSFIYVRRQIGTTFLSDHFFPALCMHKVDQNQAVFILTFQFALYGLPRPPSLPT